MKYVLITATITLFCIAATASAFDGKRKGFVLGGGLGFAPNASWSVDVPFFGYGTVSADEDKAGVGLNFIIGYAWDEFNMIVYEGNVAGYNSDFLGDRPVSQGFNGASWYHYFGPQGKSFFIAAGIGFYVFDVEDFEQNDPGGAFLVGGGYEFVRHVQVALYLSGGKTSDAGVDFGHNHINILVSAVAF